MAAAPSLQPDLDVIPGYEVYPEQEYSVQEAAGLRHQVHPLDQLSIQEISQAARLIREKAAPSQVKFNCITLREPLKKQYNAYKSGTGPRPDRQAFAIVLQKGTSKCAEVVVNLTTSKFDQWKEVREVAPTLTLEDLDVMERIARKDPRVIRACEEIGITDMSLSLIHI